MKEPSIEQKAKAYNEALKAAIAAHKDEDRHLKATLERIFPELKESDDERVRKEIIETFKNLGDGKIPVDINYADIFTWLEKQGKQEQLYIRFGEIPTDEKSKIYQGEIEVGTENGVSVYPAFKTDEGDIVLGLILPITKTTLYTQQHLLEYDNRPCYLVKGDYVGKDTDGQPLINNVSIIEKIGTYRAKEEKQGEQKPSNKVESKFHEGDWVVCEAGELTSTLQITGIKNGCYWFHDDTYLPVVDEDCLHLWTIGDARDGDVLVCNINKAEIGGDIEKFPNITPTICVYQNVVKDKDYIHTYFSLYNGSSLVLSNSMYYNTFVYNIHPATKKQRNLLFQKMKEAGYEWDDEKKELKKISQRMVSAEAKEALYDKQEWSEEDEVKINRIVACLENLNVADNDILLKDVDWLKSLRPQNNITDEELAQAKKDAYNDALDKIEYHSGEPTFDDGWSAAIWYLKKKNAMPQTQWKPSDEQIVVLELASKYERVFTPKEIDILIDLKEQLKKLKVE